MASLMLLLVLLGGAAVWPVQSACLSYAVPEAKRQLLTIADDEDGVSSSLPVGFHLQNWDSASLSAYVAMILVEEVLGFTVNITGESPNSQPGALAIPGCSYTELGVMVCPEGPVEANNIHHIAVEIWVNVGFRQEDFEALNPARTPYYFDTGYVGREGQYVSLDPYQEAMAEKGWHLDFYGDFDVRWKEPWMYFDNTSVIPLTSLKHCSDTEAASLPSMLLVQTFTPDPDGFTEEGVALCEDGYWWKSPACRATPSRCVPFITAGNGWLVTEVMQRAIAYDMPVAVSTATTVGVYTELALTYRLMYYSWEPAMHFLTLDPLKIAFPTYDEDASAEGDFRTQTTEFDLSTMLNPHVQEGSQRLHNFFSRMSLSMDDMTSLMTILTKRPTDYDYAGSACDWILNNSQLWADWIPSVTSCNAGEGLVDDDGAFKNSRDSATGCSACSPGYFSTDYSDAEGDTKICVACPAGTSQGAYRSEICSDCEEGYFQNNLGQSACLRCPKGSISAGLGNTNCTSCPSGMTTDGTGFRALDDCLCPAGTFEYNNSGGRCLSCGDAGAICTGFNADPLAASGYQLYEVNEHGLSIFSCSLTPERCPGGPLSTCARNRGGIACSECFEGTSPASDGSCSLCKSGDYLTSVAFSFAFAGLLTLLYIGNCRDRAKRQSYTGLFLVAVTAQLLSVLQLVGVTSRISVDWPEPMKSLMALAQKVNFEMDDIVQLGCVVAFSAFARYLMKLMIVPAVCLFLLLVHGIVSLVMSDRHWHDRFSAVISSTGIVIMAFFITISGLILTPFQCMQHPNGLWTMMQYPSVICWDTSQHKVMLIVGVLAASIPITFLVAVAYLLWDFPNRMARGDVAFLKTYAFILIRVNPDHRWYVLVMLCRNLLLVLIPSIPNVFRQTLMLEVVFILSFAVVFREMPWKLDVANYLDLFSTFAVLFVILTSAAFLAEVEDIHLSEVAFITICQIFLVFPLVTAFVLCRRFWKSQHKMYRWFLCHQKSTCGAFARLLKISLTSEAARLSGRVFLDSDDLTDLAKLFLVVRYDTRTLLVIASRETFRSVWCIGEVTTACIHNIDILPLHLPDFHPPEAGDVEEILRSQRLNRLSESGLGVEDVLRALAYFRLLPDVVKVPEMLNDQSLGLILDTVISRDSSNRAASQCTSSFSGGFTTGSRGSLFSPASGPRWTTNQQAAASSSSGANGATNLILVDINNIEAVSSALIFVKLAIRLLSTDPTKIPRVLGPAGTRNFEAHGNQGPIVLILFFSNGCFSCRDYLCGLMEAMVAQVNHVLPVVTTDGFQFPTPAFYDALVENVDQLFAIVPDTVDYAGDLVDSQILTPFVQNVFNKICPRLSVCSSAEVLQVQTELVVRALKDTKNLALQDTIIPSHKPMLKGLWRSIEKVRASQALWRSPVAMRSSGTQESAGTHEATLASQETTEAVDPRTDRDVYCTPALHFSTLM